MPITSPFSAPVAQWLQANAAFVGFGDTFYAGGSNSPYAGRSLGPASGNTEEVYPLLQTSSFTGLFAGLSFSGYRYPIKEIRLVKYTSNQGFVPKQNVPTDSPLYKTNWQGCNAADWVAVNPNSYSNATITPPVHSADLEFTLDGVTVVTSLAGWRYSAVKLPLASSNPPVLPLYTQHSWIFPIQRNNAGLPLQNPLNGMVIIAATFDAVYEYSAPFLRPKYVYDSDGAVVDPTCIYQDVAPPRLFAGLTILDAGEGIELSAEENTITLAKKSQFQTSSAHDYLRTISGVEPNAEGNIIIKGGGCETFEQITEGDDNGASGVLLATMRRGQIYWRNSCFPCCDCEKDYVETYRKLRELTESQNELIRTYNNLVVQCQAQSEELKMRQLNSLGTVQILQSTAKTDVQNDTITITVTVNFKNFTFEEQEQAVTKFLLVTVPDVAALPTNYFVLTKAAISKGTNKLVPSIRVVSGETLTFEFGKLKVAARAQLLYDVTLTLTKIPTPSDAAVRDTYIWIKDSEATIRSTGGNFDIRRSAIYYADGGVSCSEIKYASSNGSRIITKTCKYNNQNPGYIRFPDISWIFTAAAPSHVIIAEWKITDPRSNSAYNANALKLDYTQSAPNTLTQNVTSFGFASAPYSIAQFSVSVTFKPDPGSRIPPDEGWEELITLEAKHGEEIC
jgi:hypothetical protein